MVVNVAHIARIDLNLLLLFHLLYEERVSGRVAERLNLTPSAISHALRRLRDILQDPLFIPSPRGLTPTPRATELAPAIRDIVERVNGLLVHASGFDPTTSERRFRIAAPDGAASTLLAALVQRVEQAAPHIRLAVLQLLPRPGSTLPDDAWRDALDEIDAGRVDLAILPHRPTQKRFHTATLYSEDFVFVCRRGHPLAADPCVDAIATARHVLVSATGDATGFVDALLAEHGRERRVVLTVPSFFMAIAAVASSDLVGAVPRRFAAQAVETHPLEIVEPPSQLAQADLCAVTSQAALLDQGIAWLLERIVASVP